MTLRTVLIVLAVWTVLSLPVGIAVGKVCRGPR